MARVHLQMGQSGGGAYVRSRLGEALIESVLCEAGRCEMRIRRVSCDGRCHVI